LAGGITIIGLVRVETRKKAACLSFLRKKRGAEAREHPAFALRAMAGTANSHVRLERVADNTLHFVKKEAAVSTAAL
jgi:hypothetical protein